MVSIGTLKSNYIDGNFLPAASYNALATAINSITGSVDEAYATPLYNGSLKADFQGTTISNVAPKTFIGSLQVAANHFPIGSLLLNFTLRASTYPTLFYGVGDINSIYIGVEAHHASSGSIIVGSLDPSANKGQLVYNRGGLTNNNVQTQWSSHVFGFKLTDTYYTSGFRLVFYGSQEVDVSGGGVIVDSAFLLGTD